LKANDSYNSHIWVDKICETCEFFAAPRLEIKHEKKKSQSVRDFNELKHRNRKLIAANVAESVGSYCFKTSHSLYSCDSLKTDSINQDEHDYYSNLDELVR
jgi:hypothetical protein